MNKNVTNDDTNKLVTLNNEATPDNAVFSVAALAATAAAAIALDSHFLSSDIELFSKSNINNMWLVPSQDVHFSTHTLIWVHFKTVRYSYQSIFSLFSFLKMHNRI